MRNPMYMFFPVMTLISLLGSVAFGARGGNRTAEIDQGRRDYLRYLDSVDVTIAKAVEGQRLSLAWTHPDPEHCGRWSAADGCGSAAPTTLTSGMSGLGLGAQCLSTRLVPPELGPADELDPVTSTEVRRLIRNRSTVLSCPSRLALNELSAVTFGGDMAVTRNLLRAVMCQLAVLHSPDHVRIVDCSSIRSRPVTGTG